MRLSLGLSNVVEDAVLAVPVNRLMDAPMLGLAAKRDKGGPLQCHRVVLLVEGTEESDCEIISTPRGQWQSRFSKSHLGMRVAS